MPSLLRRIIVEGEKRALDQAFQDMINLIQVSDQTHARMLQVFSRFVETGKKPTAKLEVEYDLRNSNVPHLFFAMAKKLVEAPNPHYQVTLLCLFMLYDSALFGRWMLYGETQQFQAAFMRRLGEIAHNYIDGVKIKTGEKFLPNDDLSQRKTGPFTLAVSEYFACL